MIDFMVINIFPLTSNGTLSVPVVAYTLVISTRVGYSISIHVPEKIARDIFLTCG
jgi:hypothetical protein